MYDSDFNRPLSVNNINEIGHLGNLFYYKKLNEKLEQDVGDFLRKNTVSPSLYSNDIRHQYVSALYTRNLGANWAALLGEINEIFDFNMSGRNDTLT
ncbi:hypothetical protein IJE86_08295, partial [bacterium]|nr:hypothetical protein [bacterium]